MALFELEDGRLVPAQFGREVPEGFTDDVLQAVRMQVLEIVSRPLFPITWATGSGGDESAPRLTALDAAGQVVAVEVVRHLDADVLIEALSRLADSASMSWTDLARQYPHGVEGFKRGWAKFREMMPTSPPNGPRMVLVAAGVAPEVRPALDVLSSSGVEVHEMSLRQTSNGRAFLEVEPVGQRLYNHRFTPVLDSANLAPSLAEASRKSRRANAPELAGVQSQDVLARRRRSDQPAHSERVRNEPIHSESEAIDKAATPPPVAAQRAAVASSAPQSPSDHGEPETVQVPPTVQETPTAPATSLPSRRRRTDTGTTWVPVKPAESAPTPPGGAQVSLQPPASPLGRRTRSSRHEGRVPAASKPFMSRQERRAQARQEQARQEQNQVRAGLDAAGLRVLARMLNDDVSLSLRPATRGPATAILSLEGQIVVPAGAFTDPSQALRAMGIYGEDGWSAWHLGDERGPTLRESIEEINRS